MTTRLKILILATVFGVICDGIALRPKPAPAVAISADSEADEDDCAGDGPDDALAIAREHPESPCPELLAERAREKN